jgi:broad specificity phosphatase PhoE
MALPNHLIFVRHGLSEGDIVSHNGGDGDPQYYTDEFRERPGIDWRLAERGVEQAKAAGSWISRFVLGSHPDLKTFQYWMVSSAARAMETAAHLDLPQAAWRVDTRARERDWGDIGSMPRVEYEQAYPDNAASKQREPLYWRPPGGESIAQVAEVRVSSILRTLHQQHDENGVESVIIVAHGEFIWAAHLLLERMAHEQWKMAEKNASRRLRNGQVVQFDRLHPETGEQAPTYAYRRSVCSWETPDSEGEWHNILPRRYTNQELLEIVHRIPPLDIPSAQKR